MNKLTPKVKLGCPACSAINSFSANEIEIKPIDIKKYKQTSIVTPPTETVKKGRKTTNLF